MGVFVENDIIRIAASLDQASNHIVAQTLVSEAQHRDLRLLVPTEVGEIPGEGIKGRIDGKDVLVGGLGFVASRLPKSRRFELPALYEKGAVVVAVAIDGKRAGLIVLADELRRGIGALLKKIRTLGVERLCARNGRPA